MKCAAIVLLSFVGSDLSICVTDALLQPVRELEHTTHWREDIKDGDSKGSVIYTPCKEGEQGARKCDLDDLPSKQVSSVLALCCTGFHREGAPRIYVKLSKMHVLPTLATYVYTYS